MNEDFNLIKQKAEEFDKKIAISKVVSPPAVVETYFTMKKTEMWSMSDNDLHAAIFELSQYLIYLVRFKGEMEFRSKWLEQKLDNLLEDAANKQQGKTLKERKALAYKNNPEFTQLNNEFQEVQMKYTKIKDLSDPINALMFSLKEILKDRIQDKRYGKTTSAE